MSLQHNPLVNSVDGAWKRLGDMMDIVHMAMGDQLPSGGQTGRQMGDAGNPEGLAPAFNPYLLLSHA
jgi:hypothetical protein